MLTTLRGKRLSMPHACAPLKNTRSLGNLFLKTLSQYYKCLMLIFFFRSSSIKSKIPAVFKNNLIIVIKLSQRMRHYIM